MADSNQQAIQSAIDQWLNSSSGKAVVRELSEREALAAANELCARVKSVANNSGLPASVLQDVYTLQVGTVSVNRDGTGTIELSFATNPARPSLYPEQYGGVSNIIALFNRGYDAPGASYIRGNWHGQYVHGRPHREALNFMQQAVDAFNSEYGQYGIVATLNDEY